MAKVLEPESYTDVHTLASALAIAVSTGFLSREQATAAFKEQLYAVSVLKRPVVVPKPEGVRKTK